MPVHDWTKVDDGIFHDFHSAWITSLRSQLNHGLLPAEYYALSEQLAGLPIPDVITLHSGLNEGGGVHQHGGAPPRGENPGVALAEVQPKVRSRIALNSYTRLRRTLTIRHVSGHRVVAVIEILSPGNKKRAKSLDDFVTKCVQFLDAGVHLLLIDLFPPGLFDPQGIPEQLAEHFNVKIDVLPKLEPLTLSFWMTGRNPEAFLEYVRVGSILPPMPLFLDDGYFVNLPLDSSYEQAFAGMLTYWRDVLERV